MRSCVVKASEIAKDPTHNMSAKYWCDKKEKKEPAGESFSAVLNKETNKEDISNEQK